MRYGKIGEADYFTRVGLNVWTALTDPYVHGTKIGKKPIIDELNDKEYDKVFLHLGINEIGIYMQGWIESTFISSYSNLVDKIVERQPYAKIFLLSILPVTEKTSNNGPGYKVNERIYTFNHHIAEIAAEKGAKYLDVTGYLRTESGSLKDSAAASDGIHIIADYSRGLVEYLRSLLAEMG